MSGYATFLYGVLIGCVAAFGVRWVADASTVSDSPQRARRFVDARRSLERSAGIRAGEYVVKLRASVGHADQVSATGDSRPWFEVLRARSRARGTADMTHSLTRDEIAMFWEIEQRLLGAESRLTTAERSVLEGARREPNPSATVVAIPRDLRGRLVVDSPADEELSAATSAFVDLIAEREAALTAVLDR